MKKLRLYVVRYIIDGEPGYKVFDGCISSQACRYAESFPETIPWEVYISTGDVIKHSEY